MVAHWRESARSRSSIPLFRECRWGARLIINWGIPPSGRSRRLGMPQASTSSAARFPTQMSPGCLPCATRGREPSPPFRSWRRDCQLGASTVAVKFSLVAPGPREVAQRRDPTSSKFDIPHQCLEYSARAAVCSAAGRSWRSAPLQPESRRGGYSQAEAGASITRQNPQTRHQTLKLLRLYRIRASSQPVARIRLVLREHRQPCKQQRRLKRRRSLLDNSLF
jgi:hypothetical protein